MSRIAPPSGEQVEATPRKRLTAHERDEILVRQGFNCAGCRFPLCDYVGRTRILRAMVDEHIVPLWLGGSNDLSNREFTCEACAYRKTKDDISRIAKTKRLIRKHTEPRPPSRFQSRGFNKSKSRRFDGRVVDR